MSDMSLERAFSTVITAAHSITIIIYDLHSWDVILAWFPAMVMRPPATTFANINNMGPVSYGCCSAV